MAKPLFSVIIPALNEEKFLPHLLASLANQSKKNFEVIVVDGNSTDKTVSVAQSFKKSLPSLQVITSKKSSLPLQRNLGAGVAQGEWFVFVDADSVLLPYCIERFYQFIADKKPKLFTSWASPDSENPKDSVYTLFANLYIETTTIFKHPVTPGPMTVVHKSAYEEVGGYDETHQYHEDVDFGLRLFKRGITMEIIPESLYIWSLRRFRKQGTLKVLNQYVLSVWPMLLNRPMKYMPGYVMGGQIYGKKKKINRSVLLVYERKLKQLLKELFV